MGFTGFRQPGLPLERPLSLPISTTKSAPQSYLRDDDEVSWIVYNCVDIPHYARSTYYGGLAS